jgi:hypothetical protein
MIPSLRPVRPGLLLQAARRLPAVVAARRLPAVVAARRQAAGQATRRPVALGTLAATGRPVPAAAAAAAAADLRNASSITEAAKIEDMQIYNHSHVPNDTFSHLKVANQCSSNDKFFIGIYWDFYVLLNGLPFFVRQASGGLTPQLHAGPVDWSTWRLDPCSNHNA